MSARRMETMSTATETRITPEEYLRQERLAETKSEYDDGVVYAMSGGTRQHSLIAAGLIATLIRRLPSRCHVHTSDMRLQIENPTKFFYPDVTVVCGDEKMSGEDNLLNPLVIFEVLSGTTEHIDRGRKFLAYQTVESLQEYVLVSQNEYLVEHFRRDGDQWVYAALRGVDATLPLASAGCDLPLREIYYQLELTAAPANEEAHPES